MTVGATEDMTPKRGHPALVRKVAELVRRERIFPPGSKVLVMVSGGQDSLALLHLLASGGLGAAGPVALHALHVNYHLRGAESDADEALVVDACARLGVGLTVEQRPLEKSAGNVQEVAREARRQAAESIAGEQGCDRIALGHTVDDQVETMLYRMGRYGGLPALAGMRPSDPPWVRPLLACRRRETEEYCRAHDLRYARDRGNEYPGYARTGLRESVLPAWEAALPGAVAAAARTAEVAAEVMELVGTMVQDARETVRVPYMRELEAGDASGLSASALLSLPVSLRRLVLHDWLSSEAMPRTSRASVLAVESLLSVPGSARRSVGGGWRAVKEYDVVTLEHGLAAALEPEPAAELPVPGDVAWAGKRISAELVEGFRAVEVKREAIIDADSIDDVLRVRGPVPGDSLRPLGSPGSRKLKDVFVDLKVPARERSQRPLVVCGERVVWVCGLVVAEEVRVTSATRRYLRLSLEVGGDGGSECEL